MTTTAGKYLIELDQIKEQGNNWTVRVFEKGFLHKKKISNDWFLEEQQARMFAKQLQDQLNTDSNANAVRDRKPGWTLVRAAQRSGQKKE